MKLQKKFEKKMTKIDIKLKNLSSSPKKEQVRAVSPIKVRINNDFHNRACSKSPLRNNYNHDVVKIKTTTLLANLKNNNNISNKSNEKNSFEIKKNKILLPAISQKIINVTNGHISRGMKINKDSVKLTKDTRTSRSIEKRSDSQIKNKTSNETIFYQNNYSPRVASPLKSQHHNRILLQSPSNSKRDINKNSSEMKMNLSIKEKNYFYMIVPGNNSSLIKNCMAHRINWRECPTSATSLFHFKWQQSSIGVDFNNFNRVNSIKQSFNHFEGHPNISNKLNLFVNMFKYCESNGLDVFRYLPFTVIIHYESPNYLLQLENFSKLFINIKDYVGYNPIESKKINKLEKRYSNLFTVNNSDKLGNKTNAYIYPSHYDGKNLWLVKAPDMNRGRCIKLVNNIASIQKTIKKFYDGIHKDFKYSDEDENKYSQSMFKKLKSKDEDFKKNPKQEGAGSLGSNLKKYRTNLMLLQKYIEKPFLYNGRKFDIRIWVLISHELDVYAFKEGHLKTASLIYNNNNIDTYVHLTNYSVQKYNDNFSKYEYGNEVSFREFQNFLNNNFPDKRIDVRTNIYNKILEIIKLSYKSVKDKLKEGRKYTFEIFGYDFILDFNMDIYLLEINTNPGLEESSPLISHLVPRMIDDALRITIDTIFDTKYSCLVNGKYFSPYHVDGYNESENMWDLVCKSTENKNILKNKRL